MSKIKKWCEKHKNELLIGVVGATGMVVGAVICKQFHKLSPEDIKTLKFIKSFNPSNITGTSFIDNMSKAAGMSNSARVYGHSGGTGTISDLTEFMIEDFSNKDIKQVYGAVVFVEF